MTSQNNWTPTIAPRRAILLTCYMTGSTEGRNLGTAGYSYDFVARLFSPLLERWGEVIPVPQPALNLEKAADNARQRGLEPIHVSFLPLQDVHLCPSIPNVVVPAWEFPDIPNHEFDDNPKNNWVATSKNCQLIVVGGPFTEQAFRRAGVTTPIRIVPVPTPDYYFGLAPWHPSNHYSLPIRAYWPRGKGDSSTRFSGGREQCIRDARSNLRQMVRCVSKAIVGPERYQHISDQLKARRLERRARRKKASRGAEALHLNYPMTPTLDLNGVVYASLFNPDDGRKNWTDLLNAYLTALADREDATLVLKLIMHRRQSVEWLVNYYIDRDIPHRCRVAFVVDFLNDEQMRLLAEASTFYLQTTRAEGNCLPLMNFMAAGRPGISPNHSAMGDYFDRQVGWVIDSSQEPAAWPHDPQHRIRTTWGRIHWEHAVQQIQDSYQVATTRYRDYLEVSQRNQKRLADWASYQAVWSRLDSALSELASGCLGKERAEKASPKNPFSKIAA